MSCTPPLHFPQCFYIWYDSHVIVFGSSLYRFTYQDAYFYMKDCSNTYLLHGEFSLLLTCHDNDDNNADLEKEDWDEEDAECRRSDLENEHEGNEEGIKWQCRQWRRWGWKARKQKAKDRGQIHSNSTVFYCQFQRPQKIHLKTLLSPEVWNNYCERR